MFFERKPPRESPWTHKLWIYDLRTDRKATWAAEADASNGTGPDGRWRAYDYAELIARDKASLDIFWLKDDAPADTDNLPGRM